MERASGMAASGKYEDYGSLVAALTERQPQLSKRLQQVAQFFLNNPEDVAIYTIVELAKLADVQPSTISRFAKEIGFKRFNDLQAVFRQRLLGPRMTYADRMKALAGPPGGVQDAELNLDDPSVVFDTFIQSAMDSLLRIREESDLAELKGFVDVLLSSGAVHIVAARGAYGVGAYCYYGFSRVGKRTHLIDNAGSMRMHQLDAVEANDVLLVLTFDDYTPETLEVAQQAHERGRKMLVITDNELSPVAGLGEHTLFVKEARFGHFRSQVPAMVLCQSIIISYGRARDDA
jgi:DNA-binding MurR/RpiR family transcriptional regulator